MPASEAMDGMPILCPIMAQCFVYWTKAPFGSPKALGSAWDTWEDENLAN